MILIISTFSFFSFFFTSWMTIIAIFVKIRPTTKDIQD